MTDSRTPARFDDRRDAGRKLAEAARRYAAEHPIVLALPRGGVPVAYEVATALGAPMDLLFVRKIGAPGQPEYGIGAVVDGDHPQVVLNDVARQLNIPSAYVEEQKRRELQEIERRRRAYLGDREPLALKGRTVMVVDDGIATGGTVRASLRALRGAEVRRLILAVPVAAADTIESLGSEADEILCLATPDPFYAVGLYYRDFEQTSDEEVVRLLGQAQQTEQT
ncbi:phosphoribosyltransferase [Sphingomonas sp. MAH-20]|uniref:Phosphoribosyltransferase n=1 Tax=Sphingomonas horti TaxID=2682842 RepID=A0A6I4J1X7_9SPHN|nr:MULTISPECIES: phosphoribosyltransferase [Sphingomonas]MBA2919414.1 phosphoribosyltransferase [Sphingomonas sp. CGMCC 1.13658]MVO78294.1 phosphoribosyltransferase [Sphingomonas horti]